MLSDDDREEVPWLGDDLAKTKLKHKRKRWGLLLEAKVALPVTMLHKKKSWILGQIFRKYPIKDLYPNHFCLKLNKKRKKSEK